MKHIFSIPDLLWVLLTLGCLLIIFTGLKKAVRNTGWDRKRKQKILVGSIAAVSFWIILTSILSLKGFFSNFDSAPPRPLLAIMLPLPFVLAFSFSKTGTQLLRSVPQHWLVSMQSFRILVELLLWSAFLAKKFPIQMTFEGGNLDILSGLLALPIGYLLWKKKTHSSKLAIAYNLLGILLLLNILGIAVLSMPTPIRYFMNEPANTLVAQFPFVLLPAVLVPIAYSMHIFSLRQLLQEKHAGSLVVG